jgi:hypothetical protein
MSTTNSDADASSVKTSQAIAQERDEETWMIKVGRHWALDWQDLTEDFLRASCWSPKALAETVAAGLRSRWKAEVSVVPCVKCNTSADADSPKGASHHE